MEMFGGGQSQFVSHVAALTSENHNIPSEPSQMLTCSDDGPNSTLDILSCVPNDTSYRI